MESRLTFRSKQTTEAWQYKIRVEKQKEYENSNKYKFWENIDLSLKKAIIKEVDRKTAEKIILEYEWLGDMAITNKYYGIFFGMYCGGVICINTKGVMAGNGRMYGLEDKYVSYFARGACPFWTPTGTASKLLSYAIKLEKKRGAKVCHAFADTDAGEYGTVYQATNWICLGKQKSNDIELTKGNKVIGSRYLSQIANRYNKSPKEMELRFIKEGWTVQPTNKKYRYCYILAEGAEYKQIYNKIKRLITEYPKRNLNAVVV